jgi:hypothetical protein
VPEAFGLTLFPVDVTDKEPRQRALAAPGGDGRNNVALALLAIIMWIVVGTFAIVAPFLWCWQAR